MSENVDDETNQKVDEIIDFLIKDERGTYTSVTLNSLVKDDSTRKEQITPILRSIVLSKNKMEIKTHFKEFVEKLEEFGVLTYNVEHYNNKLVSIAPLFWSNDADKIALMDDRTCYNLRAHHYFISDNILICILWGVVEETIKRVGTLNITDTYCYEMFRQCGGYITTDTNGIVEVKFKRNTSYDKLISEFWVEMIPLENLLSREIRIEFGQNDSPIIRHITKKRNKNEVFFATDSIMSTSELVIVLDRIAQFNLEMDLAGTPNRKIYLENVGVSPEEIISGDYKAISDRYSKDKNNEGAGWVVLKKVKRDLNNKISEESIRVPVKLKFMILIFEEQRLKRIEDELINLRERIANEWILTDGKITKILMDENSNIRSSFTTEGQQDGFMEMIKKGQEIAYLDDKDFLQFQIELIKTREKQRKNCDKSNFKHDMYNNDLSDDKKISDYEKIEELYEKRKQERKNRENNDEQNLSLIDKDGETDFVKSTIAHQDERITMSEIKIRTHIEALRDEIREIRRRFSWFKKKMVNFGLIRVQNELERQLGDNLDVNFNGMLTNQ